MGRDPSGGDRCKAFELIARANLDGTAFLEMLFYLESPAFQRTIARREQTSRWGRPQRVFGVTSLEVAQQTKIEEVGGSWQKIKRPFLCFFDRGHVVPNPAD